ncbi:MAG: TetR/AcrR family transcriptional regulator [Clostridium sp.]|nr:TetR/AcrR family transcriptional regulator [Clostridium sp.]
MRRRQETTDMLKESMGDALLALMREKPVEKISIEEMTAKADVGRVTYFRYFKSKDELLAWKFRKLWERYTEKNGNVDLRTRSYAARNYFSFCLEVRDTIDLVYERGHQQAFLKAFLEVIRGYDYVPADEEEAARHKAEYILNYYAYGLFGLFNTWVLHGYKETPEQMATVFMSIA